MPGNSAEEHTRHGKFDIVSRALGSDLRRSIKSGIAAGAHFDAERQPVAVSRASLAAALADRHSALETMVAPFLSAGVSEPSDDAFDTGVQFAVSRAVAALQGCLAELLAVGPVCQLVDRLVHAGLLPGGTSVFVGDAIGVRGRKAADMHLLAMPMNGIAQLHGVVEVKAFACSERKLDVQLSNHWRRACSEAITVRLGRRNGTVLHVEPGASPIRIAVTAASWKLSREFELDGVNGSYFLNSPAPIRGSEHISADSAGLHWRITLRWSQEALRSAAHDLLMWYAGHLIEMIIRKGGKNPWPEMTSDQAGQNAFKQALFYSLDRRLSPGAFRKALTFYNSLGFGYALGSAFLGPDKEPRMLWHADLLEIAQDGVTKNGCYLRR